MISSSQGECVNTSIPIGCPWFLCGCCPWLLFLLLLVAVLLHCALSVICLWNFSELCMSITTVLKVAVASALPLNFWLKDLYLCVLGSRTKSASPPPSAYYRRLSSPFCFCYLPAGGGSGNLKHVPLVAVSSVEL